MTLQGVQDLQQQYQDKFGPGDYRPNLFVTYWAFRAMIGLLAGRRSLFALVSLWLTRGGRIPDQRWFGWFGLLTLPTPFLANARAGCSPRWAASRGWWCPIRPATSWCD